MTKELIYDTDPATGLSVGENIPEVSIEEKFDTETMERLDTEAAPVDNSDELASESSKLTAHMALMLIEYDFLKQTMLYKLNQIKNLYATDKNLVGFIDDLEDEFDMSDKKILQLFSDGIKKDN